MTTIRPPAELRWLVELVGEQAALRVVEAHAGTRWYVPKTPSAASPLVKLVGPAAALRLARELGGNTVKVPSCKRWRVLLYRAEGASYAEIARRVSLDESNVHRTLAAAGATRQPELPGLYPHPRA